jgi:hypothetical protein
MIARDVEGEDGALKSQFESCVTKEKLKIIQDRGSKTIDPDSQKADEKQYEAEDMLKRGQCDESFYGREFCQDFKNKLASTFDQNALIEKEEAKDFALENFKLKGLCDPHQLGQAFCKSARDKILKNPVHKDLDNDPSTGSLGPKIPRKNPTIDLDKAPNAGSGTGTGGLARSPFNN